MVSKNKNFRTGKQPSFLNELTEIVRKKGLRAEDICLVGGAALALKGLRENRDVDIVLKSKTRLKVTTDPGPAMLSENVELVRQGWLEPFGISDNQLICDSTFHYMAQGFKVVRMEVLYCRKKIMTRVKDDQDVRLLESYSSSTDWDDTLCRTLMERKRRMDKRNTWMRWLRLMSRKLKTLMTRPVRSAKRLKKLAGELSYKLRLADSIKTDLIVKQDTVKLLARQMSGFDFNRLDVIVRYLVIEEIYGSNDFALSIYRKMQDKRGPFGESEESFRALIRSVEKNGYDVNSRIPVDEKQQLIDGSHRLACALYFGVEEVPVEINMGEFSCCYGIEWFKEAGFSQEEIGIIQAEQEKLFRKWGLYFTVILWPPAEPFFDDIESDLGQIYPVMFSEDYLLDDDFESQVKRIYHVDEVADWKIEEKLKKMAAYPKRIRYMGIAIPQPRFRKKSKNFHDIAVTVEELKAKYRDRYKDRIRNYISDLIIHIGDNYRHNRHVDRVFGELAEYRLDRRD